MKFSKQETARTSVIVFSVLASLVIIFAFQNCAPALPMDGVVDASSIAVRATATPAVINTNIGGGGTYSGSAYDGTCTNSYSDDPMATDTYADVPGGQLVAFNSTISSKAAFWNLSGGSLRRGSVCALATSGFTVQAVGDFNGDLNPDVLWRDASGNTVVWLMRGSTRISTALVANIPTSYNIEGVADFNADGKEDLLLRDSSGNLAILAMNGTGSPTTTSIGNVGSAHLIEIGSYYDSAAAKKKMSLIFNSGGSLSVWYMNGVAVASQTALASGFTTTGSSTYNVLGVGDFNGDSNTDFLLQDTVTGNYRMRYSTYSGSTYAVYGDSSEYSAPSTTWALQGIQKINGDVYSDWIWVVSGGTLPILAYTPMTGSAGSLSSIGSIRAGYTFFKYSHL